MNSANDIASATETRPGHHLAESWEALKAEDPSLRARDGAAQLGVSEAELLAARRDLGIRRLRRPWGNLVRNLSNLGPVMALTRNDYVVHEKIGQFEEISVVDDLGLVLGSDIDLRIFFCHWHYGFAVTESVRNRTRRSLQFFDRDGTAVHKVYLRPESSEDRFDALVSEHQHPDQSLRLVVQDKRASTDDLPHSEVNPSDLLTRWSSLEDTHDFHGMLQELGIGRVQAFQMVPENYARRVRNDSFQIALGRAANIGLSVMVFVGNPGTVQIHTGPIHRLKQVGPWFNVLDPGFNLHLRGDKVTGAWVVRKPSRDGVVTSVEIFAQDGQQIAWLFGRRKPGEQELEAWREVAKSLTH
ncbi:MAG: hemin-degrading factor [Rhodospirillales bacterium]|nr:hemin-degrading factor [Rhodospirillales bacterium]